MYVKIRVLFMCMYVLVIFHCCTNLCAVFIYVMLSSLEEIKKTYLLVTFGMACIVTNDPLISFCILLNCILVALSDTKFLWLDFFRM